MTELEFALRVAVGAFCGVLIGAERARDHKATGMRTLSLVGLASALLVVAVQSTAGGNADAQSRVIQGLVTGVGFLGAGVILHEARDARVQGLTTAASVWVTSILGIVAGLGEIGAALISALVVAVVLLLGQGVDRAIARRFGSDDDGYPR